MHSLVDNKEIERAIMDTLETRELLGYTLETFEMKEFKEYYDEHSNNFTDFARAAFLKAISIPPAYFLEQPDETQEELLCNKLDLVEVQKKYAGFSVLVISQGNQILNATKIKTNEIETKFEAVSSITDVENVVWNKTLIRDGYTCGYLVCDTVSGKEYNRAIFIDLPLLFNKPTIIHEGFVKLANSDMVVEKDMMYYTFTSTVDYDDFQHIALAIEDTLANIEATTDVEKEEKKTILRETLEVTCQLIEEKVVPKSLLNPICKFISKNGEFSDLTTKTLLETVIAFDNNVKSLKQVNALRSAKKTIDYLWEDDWRHPREVGETE